MESSGGCATVGVHSMHRAGHLQTIKAESFTLSVLHHDRTSSTPPWQWPCTPEGWPSVPGPSLGTAARCGAGRPEVLPATASSRPSPWTRGVCPSCTVQTLPAATRGVAPAPASSGAGEGVPPGRRRGAPPRLAASLRPTARRCQACRRRDAPAPAPPREQSGPERSVLPLSLLLLIFLVSLIFCGLFS